MKIVPIFETKVYAFHYTGEKYNEYDRLMELWTDVEELRKFAKRNNVVNVNQFVENRLRNLEELEDRLDELSQEGETLNHFFAPYQKGVVRVKLSPQKTVIAKNNLLVYAIKVHDNCFVITSGAINTNQKGQRNTDNAQAIGKLEAARDYLIGKGISNDISFYTLINEQK